MRVYSTLIRSVLCVLRRLKIPHVLRYILSTVEEAEMTIISAKHSLPYIPHLKEGGSA